MFDWLGDILAGLGDAIGIAFDNTVRAMVSHGIMSGKACENISTSELEELIFLDTIPFDESRCSKVKVVSVAEPFADVISAIQEHRSISELNIK